MLHPTSISRRVKGRWRTRALLVLSIVVPIVGVGASTPVAVDAATGASVVVYDAIGSVVPGNVPSQGFQATQTAELGDMVSLATGPRALESVTVVMSSWGCESGSWNNLNCVTTPGTTFSHPLTLNVYSVTGPDAVPVLGALLATTTQTFAIPFRPSADNANCTGANAGKWFSAGVATCFNGLATPVTFTFPGTTVLPSRIVWSIAYNTSSWGAAPMGTSTACFVTTQGCGYDSLNVGVESLPGAPFAGTDIAEANVFMNSSTAGNYCDGGTGGTGTFRQDCGWTGYRPLAKITTKFNTLDTVVVKASNLHDWVVDTTALGNPAVPFGFTGPSDSVGGNGSFRFGPIGSPNGAKLEMQPPMVNSLVSDFGGMQYDFQVITPVGGTPANQFYTNVYVDSSANGIGFFGTDVGSTGFYDCRYSFVPTSSVAGWNTFSFDSATVGVNVAARHPSCGANTIGGVPAGSTIRFFRMNGGDTSASDNGLEGAYDLVALTSAGTTTTYDFEGETSTSLSSARILDTRTPNGRTVDGLHQAVGKLAAGQTYELPASGRAGLPPTTETVVLNVTVVQPAEPGFVTVFECGLPRPNASNLNFEAGEVIANSVSARTGTGGKICIYSSVVTDVLVDVAGFFRSLVPLISPGRVLDTRAPGGTTIDGQHQEVGRIAAGATYELPVAGRVGVPSNSATAVVNVASILPTDAGFLTVFPCGQPRPNASNLNYVVGDQIANSVLARIGTGGKICIYSSAETDVLVDVSGFFANFVSLVQLPAPTRVLDTRRPSGRTGDGLHQAVGRVAAGSTYELPISGRVGIPGVIESVVLNVTAVLPTSAGFVTVYACGGPIPDSSNLNFVPGEVIPNFVLVSVGAGGSICLFTSAQTDLLVDVSGYFSP